MVSIVKMQWNSQTSCMFCPLTEIISYTVIVKGNICLFMLTLICTLVIWYILYNHWPQDRGANNCYLYSKTAFCDLVIARQRAGLAFHGSYLDHSCSATFSENLPTATSPLMEKGTINISSPASSKVIRTPQSEQSTAHHSLLLLTFQSICTQPASPPPITVEVWAIQGLLVQVLQARHWHSWEENSSSLLPISFQVDCHPFSCATKEMWHRQKLEPQIWMKDTLCRKLSVTSQINH